MTIPQWVLLGFALWTVGILFITVGVYRWKRILTHRNEIKEFRADNTMNDDWYRRSMRAHANCVENLPVYTALVVLLAVTGITAPLLDRLAVIYFSARIGQSLMHIGFRETNHTVFVRFSFFAVQVVILFWLAGYIVIRVMT